MEKLLSNIDGHKTQIFSVIGLIIGYMITNNIIDQSLGNLLLSVVGIMLGVSISHHEKKKSKKTAIDVKPEITDRIHE